MDDIAREAYLTKGSLYHYIESKEELLYCLVLAMLDEHAAMREEIEATTGLSAEQRLAIHLRKRAEFVVAHIPLTTVYRSDVDRLGDCRREAIRPLEREAAKYMAAQISAARGGTPGREDRLRYEAECVMSVIDDLYRWSAPLEPSRAIDVCVRYAMSGVTAPGNA